MSLPNSQDYVAQVGPQVLSDGQAPLIRAEKSAAVVMDELHGRYYESCYRKQMFNGVIASVANGNSTNTTSAYTGLCLSNPPGSTVNLVVNKIGYGFNNVFAPAVSIGLMCGYASNANPVTNAVTPTNQFYTGSGAGQGRLSSGLAVQNTIGPIVTHVFGTGLTGTSLSTTVCMGGLQDLEGSLIIPPGGYMCGWTSNSTPIGFAWSFSWEEVSL
jgi:hypothetical protein